MTSRYDHITGRYRVAVHISSDVPGDEGVTVLSAFEFTTEEDAEAAEHFACDAANAGLTLQPRQSLYEFLAHGDEAHRKWLREAIDAFYDGLKRPPVKGLNFEPVITNVGQSAPAGERDLPAGKRLPLADPSATAGA